MSLIPRTNNALLVNPPVGYDFALTTGGSDWLWAVCALYCFSLLIVIALAYFARSGEKILHYLFTISLFVGAVSYFTMASGLGSTPVETIDNEHGIRQIFYVRYINWFVGWTPLLIALGLVSGVSWSTIIYNISLSWIWVSSYLSSALVRTTYKWGFFTFGTFAYFLLAASLLHTGLQTSRRLTSTSTSTTTTSSFSASKSYLLLASWLVFLWLLYPIAFGLDDGGNVYGVTEGFIFFGILDVLSGPLLATLVLVLARGWDYRVLNLYFTQYGRVPPPSGMEAREGEKVAAAPATETPAVVNPENVV